MTTSELVAAAIGILAGMGIAATSSPDPDQDGEIVGWGEPDPDGLGQYLLVGGDDTDDPGMLLVTIGEDDDTQVPVTLDTLAAALA